MPFITREDGERFIIPSYRDVLAGKSTATLRKEILLLSQNYGEYITLQRKSNAQYEVAFSPDMGYLLGESIWHYFKRPPDMIFCEAIPNTTEAILVIVKAGSVYLDGRFPLDGIAEELIIFLTQQNEFEIYTSGEVPISELPEEGKVSFDADSVKSFTVLDEPIFPTLPLLRIYQMQLVEPVLKSHGIGVFPIRELLFVITMIILGWVGWSYFTQQKHVVPEFIAPTNPYANFLQALRTPAPNQVIQAVTDKVELLLTIPGWVPVKISYTPDILAVLMKSTGSKTQDLFDWASRNNMDVVVKPDGMYLISKIAVPNRTIPTKIYPLNQVIGTFVDQMADVYPGNNIQMGNFITKGPYTNVMITMKFSDLTPSIFALLGKQLADLPFVLHQIVLTVEMNSLTGSITIEALGN